MNFFVQLTKKSTKIRKITDRPAGKAAKKISRAQTKMATVDQTILLNPQDRFLGNYVIRLYGTKRSTIIILKLRVTAEYYNFGQ